MNPRERGRELLSRIYENPDDDQARAVYADFLIEHDDPRGELIALQLANHEASPTLSPVDLARWLGPLARMLDVEFARGFPERARVRWWDKEVFEALRTSHQIGTIRELAIGVAIDDDQLAAILREPVIARRVETLALAGGPERLFVGDPLPVLRHLRFAATAFTTLGPLWQSPTAAHLASVTCTSALALLPWVELVTSAPATLERAELVVVDAWRCTLVLATRTLELTSLRTWDVDDEDAGELAEQIVPALATRVAHIEVAELSRWNPEASRRIAARLEAAGFAAELVRAAATRVEAARRVEVPAALESYMAAEALREAERALRPRVRRIPQVTITIDDKSTVYEAAAFTVGEHELRWIGATLCRRQGYGWTVVDDGMLALDVRVAIEPVERIVDGPNEDEVTASDWAAWLMPPVDDVIEWNARAGGDRDAAHEIAATLQHCAAALRAASALPRADHAWLVARASEPVIPRVMVDPPPDQAMLHTGEVVPEGIVFQIVEIGLVGTRVTTPLTRIGAIALAHVPRDEAVLRAVIPRLRWAAWRMRVQPPRACRHCRRLHSAYAMRDRTTCRDCGERYPAVTD